MEIKRKLKGGIEVSITADTQADMFRQLASMDEVFGDTTCVAVIDGKRYSSDQTVFRVRQNSKGHEYFEIVCVSPGPLMGYKKKIGQHQNAEKSLFPVRKLEENEIGGINGWVKYVKPAGEDEGK